MHIKTLTLALVLGLMQVSFAAQAQAQEKPKRFGINKLNVLKGAGIGCGLQAGVALILGGNKEQAIAGCVTGGIQMGIIAYQAELQNARELEREARAAGMQAQVSTKQVVVEGKQVEALNSITIQYDPAQINGGDEKTVALMYKVVQMGKKAKNTLTFTIAGSKNECRDIVDFLSQEDIADGGRHKLQNACGTGPNQIVITPVPEY